MKALNLKCVCCDKLIKGQNRVFPKREGDVRSGKACCPGCLMKALNLKCVCCDKPIKGQNRVFPKREGDVRSGKACCRGCLMKALNLKCAGCDKPIKGQKCVFPKREGDVRSGQPCCPGCRTKAIEEKNLDEGNFCEKCKATRGRDRGGISAQTDPVFGEKFWECQSCKDNKRSYFRYLAMVEKQGKPEPRTYKRRKFW